MLNKKSIVAGGAILFLLLLTVGVGIYIYINSEWGREDDPTKIISGKIAKFENEIEFKNYLLNSNQSDSFYDDFSLVNIDRMVDGDVNESIGFDMMPDAPQGAGDSGDETTKVDRYSQTNVQVLSIDESDIVKTDGNNIYYSPNQIYYYPVIEDRAEPIPSNFPPEYFETSGTYIIDALPVDKIEVLSKIEDQGDLYLYNDTIVVEGSNVYKGYDLTNSTTPELKWSYTLENDQYLISSRLYKNELYIIASMYPTADTDCVIPILKDELNNSIDINCTDIYYPTDPISSLQTISIFKIDVESGNLLDKTSFMGGSWNTIVYMSESYIYITYPQEAQIFNEIYTFIMQNPGLFTQAIVDRTALINSYDISSTSKMNEIETILDKYALSMNSDDRLLFENNLNNAFQTYLEENIRSFGGTGIVKIGVDDLAIKANGIVQGELINQFSLDEYDGFLRVATTRSGGWYGRWFSGQIETASDVVILNDSLQVVGEVTDLGLTERIYSVRFIGEMGYVVTFRQVDPFYVLDLSKPTNPELKGELKIPGYSSYLHPLKDNFILGLGMEDNRVKLSLFDVTRPSDPEEVSKYSLTEYWSEVSNNHHAFMQDPDKEIFFIPGGTGGYIFSYANNSIELEKAISDYTNVNRALYINDYLYVLTDDSVMVYDQDNWLKLNELELN